MSDLKPADRPAPTRRALCASLALSALAWAPKVMAKPAADGAVLRAPLVDTLATIRKRGVLRVGVVPVAPMVMLDDKNQYVGYSVDVARRLAADLGVKVQFVEGWWSSVVPHLLSQRTDIIITGLWMNVPRALQVNFTQPTAPQPLYLIGSLPLASQRRSLDDFNQPGVTIAVSSDPLQQQVARQRFPKAQVTPVDDDALLVLAEGRAQGVVVATMSASALVATAPQRYFLPSTEALASTTSAMAVRKGDPDFLSFLNTWLDIQREQGWLDERARHWTTPAPRRAMSQRSGLGRAGGPRAA